MMISGTGRRCSGFTLIELLVVIGILTTLAAVFVGSLLTVGEKAQRRATEALFQRISIGVDKYKDYSGFYPPDGLDGEITTGGGIPIVSTQSLYHFIGRPFVIKKPAPGGRVKVERYSSPLLSFTDSEIEYRYTGDVEEVPEDEERPAEILDKWGTPLHYDRLEGDPFNSLSRQGTPEIHLNPPDYHSPDPRDVEGLVSDFTEKPVVQETGPQNPGKYDLWSHGSAEHTAPGRQSYETEEDLLKQTLGNW